MESELQMIYHFKKIYVQADLDEIKIFGSAFLDSLLEPAIGDLSPDLP